MISASVPRLSIDQLIDIVRGGGTVRTGIDIFNPQGRLLLEKDVLVNDPNLLLKVKQQGIEWIPIIGSNDGGLWNKDGKQIEIPPTPSVPTNARQATPKPKQVSEVDRKIEDIIELKEIASERYELAKDCIKQTLSSIQEKGGRFDFESISESVTNLVDFVIKNDTAFSYLTREIFSYDDYLYNHSINVCAIGTVIMKKFNENFSAAVNTFLNNAAPSSMIDSRPGENSFTYFLPDEQKDISIGFFMHDLGKVLIDKNVLNKPATLTEEEFVIVQSHSTEKGLELLHKNNVLNPYIAKINLYHHARLYRDEDRCYPTEKSQTEIPAYVKVCKLADIYDAMTSKRCYKNAVNPVAVVTKIFHKYAEKESLLQYILHSFVKSVGIYPPGSIVALTNGQLAYVLDSEGPMLLPITDRHGETLKTKPDVIILEKSEAASGVRVDRRHPPLDPVDAYKILPEYLLRTIQPATSPNFT